jgi:decaprenyl-phosphate phosphoribosyltransferase
VTRFAAAEQLPVQRVAAYEPSSSSRRGGLLLGLVRTARPRQWVKNALVAAAPLTAGAITEPPVLLGTAIAFLAFCLTSAGVYCINDAIDVDHDRAHRTKRHRPIAAGIVPVALAFVVGALLLAAGVALGALGGTWQLGVVLASYAAISLAYCFWLKDEPVIDLVVIATGFLLRAMAGGLATGIPLSNWFLFVASFGSLFIAAGKRYSEAITVAQRGATRPSLVRYTASYLRFVWGATGAVTIAGYALWAFETHDASHAVWPVLSLTPFVVGLLQYAFAIDAGKAEAPEELISRDRTLQITGAVWFALLVATAVTH